MPHFSPISWILTGLVFYFLLCMFISLFWWIQNFSFPKSLEVGASKFNCSWLWN